MLLEAHYVAALNFFYFMLLDEGMALNAAFRAVKLTQRQKKRDPNAEVEPLLIDSMTTVLTKYKGRIYANSEPPQSDWKGPNRTSLMTWKDFVRKADVASAEILVLHYILGFEVQMIAEGLDVPEGTVYYRIGKGLESFADFPIFRGRGSK